jgi:ATP sulfurylase
MCSLFYCKIASLIVRSYGTEQQLAGTLSTDGFRQDSILDKHFSREEVSQVIAEAAEKFRKEAYDRSKAEAAAMLYMLAGRYSSVLMLLNELMAPPDQLDDDRK